ISSERRRFAVPSGAVAITFPSGAEIAARVHDRVRPRVVAAGTKVVDVRHAAATAELAQMAQSVVAAADQAMQTPIPSPTLGVGTGARVNSMAQKVDSTELRRLLDQERRFVEALGFAAMLTGNP